MPAYRLTTVTDSYVGAESVQRRRRRWPAQCRLTKITASTAAGTCCTLTRASARPTWVCSLGPADSERCRGVTRLRSSGNVVRVRSNEYDALWLILQSPEEKQSMVYVVMRAVDHCGRSGASSRYIDVYADLLHRCESPEGIDVIMRRFLQSSRHSRDMRH
jgi:hypothetical protein